MPQKASGPAAETSSGKTRRATLPRGPGRALYLTLAAVFFGLAVLGAFLPLLPTTPFLLVTSYFLIRSSPALHQKLLESKRFGPILKDWQHRRALRRGVKRKAMIASPAAVLLSAYFGDFGPAGLTALAILGLVGFVVVARLPVIEDA